MLRDRLFFGRKARSFTLQWHLTNRCPFQCKHCYDRSNRSELSLSECDRIFDDLQTFARVKGVEPHICFTGGDPLLHPNFWDLYEKAARNHVSASLLGNPISEATIHKLLEIQAPHYYQVSLEGLSKRNDEMRGEGHYAKTLEFLRKARTAGMRTHVMLTLTQDNMADVVPLGEKLRTLTCRLTFNRLSQVGAARSLRVAPKQEYAAFLNDYLNARRDNPVLGVKDNLFNIIRSNHRRPLFPGCTGHGCGAAFNFVAMLPEGEVHACRKFPSLIGNIAESGLLEIYDSPRAREYRRGPLACRKCSLQKACRGCMAVTHGHGLDPLKDCDPHCFFDT